MLTNHYMIRKLDYISYNLRYFKDLCSKYILSKEHCFEICLKIRMQYNL